VAAEAVVGAAGNIAAAHSQGSSPMSSYQNPMRPRPSLPRRTLLRIEAAIEAAGNVLRPAVTILQGTEKKTGEKIRICYAGFLSPGLRLGFPSQVLSDIDKETYLGRQWLWRIRSVAAKNDCSFLLAESPAANTGIVSRLIGKIRQPFFIPFYVKTHVRIDDLNGLLHRNEHLENDLRHLRIEGFQPEISHAPKEYRIFLEEYYQAYGKSNYGSCAMNFNYDFLCHKSKMAEEYWELIKVMADGEWLAGLLLRKSDGCADAMEVGVKHGDRSLVKRGTLAAAYWFFVQRAKELGYSEVSFMFSPPFPGNGVLQFKSKYRPKLTAAPSPDYGLLFLALNNNALTRGILLDQPFFEITQNGLGVTAFAGSKVQVKEVEKAVRKDIRRFRDAPPIRIVVLDDAAPRAESTTV
jgi:hypothetical protein